MTSQRLRQIDELFDAALAQPRDLRAAFLDDACRDDLELHREVATLLRVHEDAISYFSEFANDIAATVSAELETVVPGDTLFGSYRAVRPIGRGGMGTVYLAERADGQFDQQVALKVISLGLQDDDHVRRFLLERQILARLEHPNIARLLDGGVTHAGHPYYVMEYVDGIPITQRCDEGQLSVDQRLEVFIAVAAAVEYAHHNLVVHRDLKPSNILVTRTGEVKLLDFGIAKLLGNGNVGGDVTETGRRALTPEYAAPEQMTGEPITTATDVYALGVILYELLSGLRPYARYAKTPSELARAVLDTTPPAPSSIVAGSAAQGGNNGASADSIARSRSTTPDRLRRAISGDLDVICLKALRKEPERRYGSMQQFSDDVGRHLTGQPVFAQKDTLRYRVTKFVQRHRIGVAASAAFIFLLLVSTITLAVQSSRIARERDRADEEAVAAQQVSDFLVGLFAVSDPSEARGNAITAREILDDGAERINTDLQDQPVIQARLMSTMGQVYQALGLYDAAAPLLERALQQRRALLGNDDPQVAKALNDVAVLLQRKGDYTKAEAQYRQALAVYNATYSTDHDDLATAMHNLAGILREMNEYAEADSLLGEALAMRRRLFGNEHEEVASTLYSLAALRRYQGDLDGAEPLYRESLEMHRRLLGEDHPRVATYTNDLARLMQEQGNYDEAETMFREGLSLYRRVLDDNHPDLATAVAGLASVLHDKRDYEAAEAMYREALALHRGSLGEEHPLVATDLNNLAMLLKDKGNFDGSETMYRASLDMKERLYGKDHRSVATTMNNLAAVLSAKGEMQAAGSMFREGLAMHQRLLGDEHPYVATNMNNLAEWLWRSAGDFEEGERMHRLALAMRRELLGNDHPDVSQSLNNLAQLFDVKGEPAKAVPLHREALAIRRTAYSDGDGRIGQSLNNLASVLLATDKTEEAASLYREALAIFRQRLGAQHSTVGIVTINLANALTAGREYVEANVVAKEGTDILTQALPPNHWRMSVANSVLGASLAGLARYEEAEPLLLDAYPVIVAARGKGSRYANDALERIIALYEAWDKPAKAREYRAHLGSSGQS